MDNTAKDSGGAISCHNSSYVLFTYKSLTIFNNNKANLGGALYAENSASVTFKDSSLIEFTNNSAKQNGGALFYISSKGTFQDSSVVRFINNSAKVYGGAAFHGSNSEITTGEYSTCKIIFHNNKATQGGAVYSESNTNIMLGGQSKIEFTNNNATLGGAIYFYDNTIITTTANSLITFANNTALEKGGALVIKQKSAVILKKYSTVLFYYNKAIHDGGSVFLEVSSCISYEDHCRVIYNGNAADDGMGGAISTNTDSAIEFKHTSTTLFYNNHAAQGGALSSYNSSLTFNNNTRVNFTDNTAAFGGALFTFSHSVITIQGSSNSLIIFNNSKATQNGGAMCLQENSDVIFKGTVTVMFHNNEATLGGAINCNSNSKITSKEYVNLTFSQNNAKLGGGLYTMMSNITITENSRLKFTYNTALQDGGAMFLDKQFTVTLTGDAVITFSFNTASDYGGAIYSRIDQSMIKFNVTNIHFDNNHARTAGSTVFINVPTLCNSSCLQNSILGVSEDSLQHNSLSRRITTTRKLEVYKPADCINVRCDSYYIKNIMLGQEILIDACMYDYYDRPTGTEEFLLSSADHQDYYILESQYILISCNHTFQEIYIISNNTFPVLPFNYSMTISSYVVRISEMRSISVNLMIELSLCHPGYWYYGTSGKCECYNSTNTVICYGSSSTIKKGYWFGNVTGKLTVTFCPIDYCNFTCCETTNGYYHLSPVRDNQCMLHRCGTACGDCEVGYVLSFDSAECIEVKACTIGQRTVEGSFVSFVFYYCCHILL